MSFLFIYSGLRVDDMQVGFAEILDKVGPLRDEVDALEEQASVTKKHAETIVEMIAELETSIAQYKEEYAQLISETQAIKSEMEKVQSRVVRSVTLLDSLSSEKERWETSSTTFQSQMSTVVGDVLLASAFLAYAGYFDQTNREAMLAGWTQHLGEAGLAYRPDLSLAEYLSSADERLRWQSNALPQDDLSTENAIMLKRFNRYPCVAFSSLL
jgi:dynein heavy chain 1, cytosolic